METRLKDFSKVEKFFMLSREITGFGNSFDNLYKSLDEWQGLNRRIILFAGTKTKAQNIVKEFSSQNEYCRYLPAIFR